MIDLYRAVTGAAEWPARLVMSAVLRPDTPAGRGRFGNLPAVDGGSWLHAASAGEVRGLVPLARRLPPDEALLVTAQTAAGRKQAGTLLPNALVAAAPVDFPGIARRAAESARAARLIVAETELWPNVLLAAADHGARLALVNARISDRTLGRYRALSGLTTVLLARIAVVAAQSPADAQRFIDLGANERRVVITGNMKHDLAGLTPAAPALPWADAPIVVAGSLRDGEEDAVAEALRTVADAVPALRIVAAPRHLMRARPVGRAFHNRGFRVATRSSGGPAEGDQVLVLDTMGELPAFYRAARVAFVGGTFLPFGGHNVVEPVMAGSPVVHGPFVANCRLEAETLARNGASVEAASLAGLVEAFLRMILDDAARRSAIEGGRRAMAELAGATDRTIRALKDAGVWPEGTG